MSSIKVYDAHWTSINNDTTTALLQAVVPDSVQITFQLNDSYEASFTAYDDGSEAFSMLQAKNVVEVNGQPFVIEQVEPDYDGGLTTYSITCTHFFYEQLNANRTYADTSIRWKNWDGQLVNPNAEKGRTINDVDLSKLNSDDDSDSSDSSDDSKTDEEQMQSMGVEEFLKFWGFDKYFTYHIHGNFDKKQVQTNQDLQMSDALDLLKTTWLDIYAIPDGFKGLNIFSGSELFKDNGNRIDYLHDTNEISLTYDATTMSNAARLIGASYTVSGGGDGGGVDGGIAQGQGVEGAKSVAAKLGKELNVNPAFIFAQMMFETGGLRSICAKNNLSGMTYVGQAGASRGPHQPDGGGWYADFNTLNDYANAYGTTLRNMGVSGATSVADYCARLKAHGYFTAGLGLYTAGVQRYVGQYTPPANQNPENKGRAQEVIDFAKKFVGLPYVWGGPRGVDRVVATDCSGLTSNIYKHFGITIGTVTYTQANAGPRISRQQVQTGDLGFYDPGCHHVVMALDNQHAIQEPRPGQYCNIFNIDSYPPSYWIRNPQMAAIVGSGTYFSGDGSDSGSGGSSVSVYYFVPFFYENKKSSARWGRYVTDDITSDTITTEDEMKKYADSQFNLNPTFSMDVTGEPGRIIPFGDITRVDIKPVDYIANLKMVGYTIYPHSKSQAPTYVYNSKPENILDFYQSQQKALANVQSRVQRGLTFNQQTRKILESVTKETTSQVNSGSGLKKDGDTD